MDKLLVNILPISENPLLREEMVSQFLSAVQTMASSKYWNHKKMRFTLTWENNCFTFQGGRHHLSPHCLKFVSVPVVDIFDTNTNHFDWAKRYDQFIILADAKEVAENQTTRLEIAKYRSLMHRQKRHSEEVLLLLDVQNILTIPDGYSYENTMVGILSALAGKSRKGFALLPIYASHWSPIINLHLGQRQLMLKTKNGNVIGLPINLMGTFNAFPHSGVMEILWKFMTTLLEKNNIEIKRISNHLIYNTVMGFFKKIKKAISNGYEAISDGIEQLNTETIKLAVIGETSSGKTYLLSDMLTSFDKMNFNSEHDLDDDCSYAGDFIIDVTDSNSALDATKRSAARIDSHYGVKYKNDSKSFYLEFIDIPGEVITKDKIAIFASVIKALNKKEEEIFQVETWSNEDKTYKVLYYPTDIPKKSKVPSSGHSEILEDDEELQSGTPKTVLSQSVLTTEEVRLKLQREGYNKEDDLSTISGEDVIKDFYSFYPDTVLNAIVDAWDTLSPIRPKKLSDQNLNKETDYSKIFRNNCMLDFYYLFFCIKATDIVICNKMAIPAAIHTENDNKANEKNTGSALQSFNLMMAALNSLSDMKDVFEKKNWYLALKGSDSYMNASKFKDIFNLADQNHNTTYSCFVAILVHYLQLQKSTSKEKSIAWMFEEKNIERFKKCISSENIGLAKIKDIQKLAKGCKKDKITDYFKSREEYIITSKNDSNCSEDDLSWHITQCIKRFEEVIDFRGKDEESLYKRLQIPPHVYFPSTPITDEFKVCGHKKGAPNSFEGDASYAGNRLCFGTFQLCLDILRQHKIKPENSNTGYGGLLSYFMDDPED